MTAAPFTFYSPVLENPADGSSNPNPACNKHCVSPDLQISWFCNNKEIWDSDIFRMSQYSETYQLEISRVLPSHEGEYSCVATNSAGMVTTAASLNIDGKL